MNDKDIKILESYLEQQDRKFVSEYRLEFLQAIENLLKENKELKKEKEVSQTTGIRNGKTIELAMQLRKEILELPEGKLYGIKNCKNKIIALTKNEVVPVSEMNKRISEILNAKIGVDLSNENYISDEKEQEIIKSYRNLKEITGSDAWIVCNPETMWSEYFVPVAKIKEKIKEAIEKRDFYVQTDKEHILVPIYNERIYILKELLEGK